jgi:hypothetical protein
MSQYVSKGARLSADGRYRYRLWREWRNHPAPAKWRWMEDEDGTIAVDGAGEPLGTPLSVLFIMLNPSTADAEVDDPTIRRCVGFAKTWGYDRMEVVNLFAYRTKDPRELLALKGADDPVGPLNSSIITEMIESRNAFFGSNIDRVICAWGNHGSHMGQDETALGWLGDCPAFALRTSKDGQPCHPLYLPGNLEPQPFFGARRHRRAA